MITEHALLDVLPGSAEEFEWAFGEARELISASPGFRGLELLRCLETPSRYLLLVRWDSVESHTVAVFEPGDLTDASGGVNEVWMDLRRREVTVTSTLAHILADSYPAQDLRPRR